MLQQCEKFAKSLGLGKEGEEEEEEEEEKERRKKGKKTLASQEVRIL